MRRTFIAFLMAVMLSTLTQGVGGDNHISASSSHDALRLKWKTMLTGGTAYNPADPYIAVRITEIDQAAQNNWDTMLKSANRAYLWSDASNVISVPKQKTTTYSRLAAMALAYATKGSDLEGNVQLRNDILSALDWLYQNAYNETMPQGSSSTWWDWEIGVPQALHKLVILMHDDLSPQQVNKHMAAIGKFVTKSKMLGYTGANRVWVANIMALMGVLREDSQQIADARDALSNVLLYVTGGDGFYRDGSFIQHNTIPYNGGYGRSLLLDLSRMVNWLDGSAWEVTDPNLDNMILWVYQSFEPFMHKGLMMDMTRGREISRYYSTDHISGQRIITAVMNISNFAPASDAAAFRSMVKSWIQQNTYLDYYQLADIPSIVQAKAIVNNSDIPDRVKPQRYFQFAAMDRAVQVRPGYTFGLSMSSNRISTHEVVSGENLRGWYTAEGMTYLYNNDISQYTDDFWPTVNAYRLPGTTVDTRGRVAAGSELYRHPLRQAGGTELGAYGTSAMQVKAQDSTLMARKSWFNFDDEIVALGAGITSTDNRTIETTVENRKLTGAGDQTLTVNGQAKPSNIGWTEAMSNVDSIHLAGNVAGSDLGYYFPGGASVKGLREQRTGAWSQIDARGTAPTTPITRPYMTLWFDHGANPTNASYSYVLLPNKTASQVSSYADNPQISILENSSQAQAVRENTLQITGIQFWEDAVKSVGGVTSNKKASVMLKETDTEIEISISDPSQANTGNISIELEHGANATLSVYTGITVTQLSPTIKFNVNVAGAHGKTFKATFAKKNVLMYETENLAATASSGDSHASIDETGMSGGKGTKLEANAVGDYVTYNVPVSAPGTYRVLVRAKTHNSRGKAQLSINGSNQGEPYDYFRGISDYVEVDLGEKLFHSTGTKQFKFTITGKHVNSGGHSLVFDYIKLIRTDGIIYEELENLPATISTGDSRTSFPDSNLSGGSGDKFEADAPGDFIDYTISIPKTGTYEVYVGAKKHRSRGIFRLRINNIQQGELQDSYAWNDAYTEFHMGQITFTKTGVKSFKFGITGKHPDSGGYALGLDYVKLVPVQ
jgi:hyaluronate lyase